MFPPLSCFTIHLVNGSRSRKIDLRISLTISFRRFESCQRLPNALPFHLSQLISTLRSPFLSQGYDQLGLILVYDCCRKSLRLVISTPAPLTKVNALGFSSDTVISGNGMAARPVRAINAANASSVWKLDASTT